MDMTRALHELRSRSRGTARSVEDESFFRKTAHQDESRWCQTVLHHGNHRYWVL
jgi:hypothetical protein